MALIKHIEVIKSRLSEVPIHHGQLIFCTDTNDIYMDNSEGLRVQMSDIIKIATEIERESIIVPLLGKIYLVEENNKLYKYNGTQWEELSIDISINDNLDSTDLKPGILEKRGIKYAPKTLASVVYLEDGQPLSQKLDDLTTTQLAYHKNQTILKSQSNIVQIGITGFDKNRDLLLVYKNSVYIEENVDYTISSDNLYIQKIEGNWEIIEELCFNFIVIKKVKYSFNHDPDSIVVGDNTISEQKLSENLRLKINSYESEILLLKEQISELQTAISSVLIVNA